MSDDNALVPIEQKQVVFYEDEITAVQMNDGRVFIPVRPLVERLGVAWGSQLQRIRRDPVLNDELLSVFVTNTESKRGGRDVQCLPLDYISGFLFGINANRVSSEVRDDVIQYQRECYMVLAEAFRDGRLTTNSDANFESQLKKADPDAADAYNTALAIMKLARNHIMLDGRIDSHERQLRFHDIRLEDVEDALGLLGDDPLVSEAQASQISQAVQSVATVLGRFSHRNEFGGVYGELYRRYTITGYKSLPARQFRDAMKWLSEWLAEVNSYE